MLFRRGPWGLVLRCHPEERSDAGSPMGAGSAPVGVQARDLLLPFRVGFCLKRSAGAFSPASSLWARVCTAIRRASLCPSPRPSFRARCRTRPDAKRHASKIAAPERSYGARGIPPRLCSSLFGEGSCRMPSRRHASRRSDIKDESMTRQQPAHAEQEFSWVYLPFCWC